MTESWKTRYDMGFDSKMILCATEDVEKAIKENTEAIKEAENLFLKD